MAVPAIVGLLPCRKGLFLDAGELIRGDHHTSLTDRRFRNCGSE